MDVAEFRENLLNDAAAWAASEQDFQHSSFLTVAVRYLEEAGEVTDFQPTFYRGIGEHNRSLAIDGYSFDEADDSVRVFLVHALLGNETSTLTQTEAKTLFGRLAALVEQAATKKLALSIEVSSQAHDFAIELERRFSSTTRIRAYLLTDALLSSRVRDWPEGSIGGVPVEYHVWDISRFHRLFESQSGRDDLVVDLSRVPGGGIPCIDAGAESDEYSAYLCVVPGRFLAEIYEEYGSRLLEGNVRSFLAVRGKVNKGIRNTVLNAPGRFFAYNNGIAATATSVELQSTGHGHVVTSATDLQIVNGGQTTASLASAHRNDKASLEDVFVPMKLSIVPPEKADELIPQISRYANSQNKVSEADFFSNHPYHRRLEEISRRLRVPARPGAQHETHWFYERTRGQYLNETALLTPARRRNFEQLNPRDQVATKVDVAKCENAWRQLPHIVSRGAQKNFLDFATFVTSQWVDETQFHEEYWQEVVAHLIVFRQTEKLVGGQAWYSGGYRANVVAYAVSGLSYLVEARAPELRIDFRAIWRNQALSAALRSQLGEVAEAVHEVIVRPERAVENVTEWSKQAVCWTEAKDRLRSIELRIEFTRELVAIEDHRSLERDARVQQKQDSGIDAQTEVVRLGSAYWKAAATWSRDHHPISPGDYALMEMMVAGWPLPTDRQSKRLLEVKERLELEGMPPPSALGS